MKITKIKIENFKSIKEIEFVLKKYGNSYTTMLVGINESGKSNILEAMSYFDTPEDKFDYNMIHNQKDEGNNPVDFWFSLAFEQKKTCVDEVKKEIENGELLDFEIENIVKNVYLQDGEETFSDDFTYEIKKLSKELFIKKSQKNSKNTKGVAITIDVFTLSKENDSGGTFQELTQELFEEFFSKKIKNTIRSCGPNVSMWCPSEKYLVSEVDLNKFKDNIHSNIPFKHIFYIAGFTDTEKIKSEIKKIGNQSLRRGLASKLGSQVTKYVKKIWQHNIVIDIEIAENGICTVSIRDDGKENEHNFHKMAVRSEGFKQFISLILSLSVETKLSNIRNNLILIDEPEAHLHPSGIRDLRKELLSIGENNYLFVSTHSPFLVDRENKERNIIIKKNRLAETEAVEIDKNTDVIDDEVLREAFGIEVYKDLLNPHRILVEGASDKKIIQKAFVLNGLKDYGITNGHGSNIDTLASKLNDTDISIFVVLDDDEDGKRYKDKILKIKGSYSADNVVTIHDLVGDIVGGGTVEDALCISFLKSKIKENFEEIFNGEEYDFTLDNTLPSMNQVRIYLQQKKKSNKMIDVFLEKLKTKISDDFQPSKPSKPSFKKEFSLLDSLCKSIVSRLNSNT